ncbi:MAG: hypothetical protein HN952_04765 [Candidatus Cloacimonetes bacterium]|jgi:hypothetical protein|nr:hypothetical protein [Candidatus Cloacimonadota bacterium]
MNKFQIIILLTFIPILAFSQQILVWDNDNNSQLIHHETGDTVGCEYAIQEALIESEINFTTLDYLPEDLSEYDVIFTILGIYCLG